MGAAFDSLTPREIVAELDRYIVGQEKAKKAVAVALRNRMRRQRLPESMRDEVSPKNILMIGPTGVGKTEIARRLAKLCGAPFIKVEATKYTEVGYVGRDVESMIRDLMMAGYSMVKQEMRAQVKEAAEKRVEELLLDALLPGSKPQDENRPLAPLAALFAGRASPQAAQPAQGADPATGFPPAGEGAPKASEAERPRDQSGIREKFREMLRAGQLEDRKVEITVSAQGFQPSIEVFQGGSMEEMEMNFSGLANLFGGKKKKKSMSVAEARAAVLAEEMDKLIDGDRVSEEARRRVEETGIVFIDEIDKIANRESKGGGQDVSREGVQRDILPIVEGSTVNTKHGMVDTSHILFIAAGAFTVSKPQDLIPELQGRFPIRVELEALSAKDFVRILTEPENALVRQYVELLKTEGVEIVVDGQAVERIAQIAQEVNARNENIGARRLHTIMERLLEELSFAAPELSGQRIPITKEYVEERFRDFFERQDLSRYIL
jgi:ATP-dependent HslUV protease ATP-binding subunit HslU